MPHQQGHEGTHPAGDDVAHRPARTRAVAPLAAAVALAVLGTTTWYVLRDDASPPRKEGNATALGTAPVADFDGDGQDDLVVHGSSHLAVAYGNRGGLAEGRRQTLSTKAVGAPADARGVHFDERVLPRDFDGDGYTDLALPVTATEASRRAGDGRNGVRILWGGERGLSNDEQDGTWLDGLPKDFHLYAQNPTATLAAGDFDGDGHADLVVGVGAEKGLLRGPFTREGEPAGTTEVPRPDVPKDAQLDDVLVGDMNGDGADDLVTTHSGESDHDETGKGGSYLAGGPDGFSEPAGKSPVPPVDSGVLADVDQDGRADLVAVRHPEGVPADEGPDDDAPLEVVYGTPDGPEESESATLKPGNEPWGSVRDAGDVDGDGYADVVVGRESDDEKGTVRVLHGGPDGLTDEDATDLDLAKLAEDTEAENTSPGELALLDLDDDAYSDLALSLVHEDEEGSRTTEPQVLLLPGAKDGPRTADPRRLPRDDFDLGNDDLWPARMQR